MPKWLNKGIKEKSIEQEKELASEIGATLTPNSGATTFKKGDCYTKQYLIESKATIKESFSLKKSILEKIELEALGIGKMPLLLIDLNGKKYVVLRIKDIDL